MSKLIIANWKSNKNRQETINWLNEFTTVASQVAATNHRVVIAPALSAVALVADALQDKAVFSTTTLGVQDLSPFPAGQYTGAVSTQTLEGFGVTHAIVGHSERRRHFHETHQDVANKVSQALENGIKPIVCVDDEYIAQQAAAIDPQLLKKCVVAYEELGAIGTGNNEPVTHVIEVVARIKQTFGTDQVIYGGSVKPANASQYLEICAGVLVGGASLEVQSFLDIITS